MGVTITPHNLKLWFYLRNLAKQGQISSIWECYMRLLWLYVLQIFVLFNYVCVPVCLRMSAREGQVPTGSRIKHQIQTLLELKLQAAGSCLTWVMGTDLCQRSNNGPISLAISLRSTSINSTLSFPWWENSCPLYVSRPPSTTKVSLLLYWAIHVQQWPKDPECKAITHSTGVF